MFTGIVEQKTKISAISFHTSGAELFLDIGGYYDNLLVGESISVNGVCLTIKKINGNTASFDISHESLKKTTMGLLRSKVSVNVERALRIGDRLGGHFVTGHVDGIGTIREKKSTANQCIMSFSVEKSFTDMMIEKGSVAVDGISLTTFNIKDGVFTIALVPHTLNSTTLGLKKVGDKVNIEIDMMGKWIKRLLANIFNSKKVDIRLGTLEEQGF